MSISIYYLSFSKKTKWGPWSKILVDSCYFICMIIIFEKVGLYNICQCAKIAYFQVLVQCLSQWINGNLEAYSSVYYYCCNIDLICTRSTGWSAIGAISAWKKLNLCQHNFSSKKCNGD